MTPRDWQLERHRLGELPAPQAEAVAQALAADEVAAGRARAIEASDREILAAHPPRVAAAVIRARLASAARKPPAGIGWRSTLLALASVAVVAAGTLVLRKPAEPVAEDRIKGLRPGLLIYRHTPAGNEALADGTAARPGDLVQVVYQAAGRRYGVIVSVDGRGAVTVHHPRTGNAAAPLVAGGLVRLTTAYRLDDAPRWERFYFVTSDRPFHVETVVGGARRLVAAGAGADALPLPRGLEQSSFTLSKEEPR